MRERYRIYVPWGAFAVLAFIGAAPHLLMWRWNEVAVKLPAQQIDMDAARSIVALLLIVGGLLTVPVWGFPRTVVEKDETK